MKAVVPLSGGLDSSTLLWLYKSQGYEVSAINFDYGQKHIKERDSAMAICEALNCPLHLVDLRSITQLITNSSLTNSDIPVPDGHYSSENMKATVVPNRNAILLAVAYAHAVNINAEFLCIGVHSGDHFIYPDCRESFITSLKESFRIGNEGFGSPLLEIVAPFNNMTKTDIVKLGSGIGVPFEKTWSCYKGQDLHCGTCGTCYERIEAFRDSGVSDPTIYQSFWSE
jgi:7-cyano-7-deazaguanine synthase